MKSCTKVCDKRAVVSVVNIVYKHCTISNVFMPNIRRFQRHEVSWDLSPPPHCCTLIHYSVLIRHVYGLGLALMWYTLWNYFEWRLRSFLSRLLWLSLNWGNLPFILSLIASVKQGVNISLIFFNNMTLQFHRTMPISMKNPNRTCNLTFFDRLPWLHGGTGMQEITLHVFVLICM
jgi:hypothetical protein